MLLATDLFIQLPGVLLNAPCHRFIHSSAWRPSDPAKRQLDMAGNLNAMKKKAGKGKSIFAGLLGRFSKKKSCKEKECSSQVHPIIPYQLSRAYELTRPYRPCLVLSLETISEEEDEYLCKSPFRLTPIRTPLYFVKGSQAKRFRFRRYVKVMWRVHSTRLRCNLTYVLRLFRIKKDRQHLASSSRHLADLMSK